MTPRILFITTVATFIAVAVAPASAQDGEAWCKSFTAGSGYDETPCSCVIAAVEGDAALAEELYSYADNTEYDANASSALRKAIADCIDE